MTRADELPDLLARLRARLEAGGAQRVQLAELVPERRILGFRRRPTLRKAGEGWLLGVLILSADGMLLDAGTPTRAKTEARVGYVAESARERDALRHMAARAGYRDGERVHIGAARIDPAALAADGPVSLDAEGRLVVRWSPQPGIAARPIAAYLDERVELAGA